ncbi:hypothetical protein DFQ30_006017, partial [Apophysomyces sp. BC1015]
TAFFYDTSALLKILECQLSPCSSEFWFLALDCAQLVADAFNTPVAIYTGQGKGAQMFLPVGLPLRPSAKPIVLQFVNGSHIILIDLKADTTKFPWPPINECLTS